MDKTEVCDLLAKAGIRTKESRHGNDYGWRIDCDNGAIVNVYDSGKG